MRHITENTALLVIDVQRGMDDPRLGNRNNLGAEDNIARLLHGWRLTARPVIHVRHDSVRYDSPLHPDHPGNAIKDLVTPLPDEKLISKSVNSAFIGTDLEAYLRDQGLSRLIMVGLTTPHCVSTTARMGGNLGFDVTVVDDATAAFDRVGYNGRRYPAQQVHDIALANLHNEFATITTTDRILLHLMNA